MCRQCTAATTVHGPAEMAQVTGLDRMEMRAAVLRITAELSRATTTGSPESAYR